jgi:hypothetical protein
MRVVPADVSLRHLDISVTHVLGKYLRSAISRHLHIFSGQVTLSSAKAIRG